MADPNDVKKAVSVHLNNFVAMMCASGFSASDKEKASKALAEAQEHLEKAVQSISDLFDAKLSEGLGKAMKEFTTDEVR